MSRSALLLFPLALLVGCGGEDPISYPPIGDGGRRDLAQGYVGDGPLVLDLTVPDDLSLAADSNPPLSTVRQSSEAAGKALVDLLLAKLRGEVVESIVMPTEFVGRESSGVGR